MAMSKMPGYVSIASLYFMSVGVLYLWGYWKFFGINIFEYMSISDVIRYALFPLLSGFFAYISGVVFALPLNQVLPSGGGKNSNIGIVLNKYKVLFAEIWIAIFILAFVMSDGYGKWFLFSVAFLPLVFNVQDKILTTNFLIEALPSEAARKTSIFILLMLPIMSFSYGKMDAIAQLKSPNSVSLKLDGENHLDCQKENEYKLLGHVGQYLFLLTINNKSVMIVSMDKVLPMSLNIPN